MLEQSIPASAAYERLGDGISVVLLEYTRGGERLVAAASKATVSGKPLDPSRLGEDEVEEWIRETFRRQHFSPWEHSTYTWAAEGCSRVCTHQLVRHRLASYSQQSMRYTEGFLRRAALRAARWAGLECPEKPGRGPGRLEAYRCYARALRRAAEEGGWPAVEAAWEAYVLPRAGDAGRAARTMLEATAAYYDLLSRGVPREEARLIVPQAARTRIVVSMNARELATVFIPLRACTRAQWEIRLVAWRLLRLLLKVHPRLFAYTGPRCVLAQNTLGNEPRPLREYLDGGAAFTIPRCPELVPREGIPACLAYAARTGGWIGDNSRARQG